MTKCAWIILIVFSLYHQCLGSPIQNGGDGHFDFFVYTELWPGTFCLNKDCDYPKEEVSGWNIHGLWPSSYRGRGPMFCKAGAPFNKEAVSSIFSELQKEWADLYNYNNPIKFWVHEWMKHGRCALSDEKTDSELEFFQQALDLKRRLSTTEILQRKNIVPSMTRTYTASEIVMNLKAHFPYAPTLHCRNINDKQYLYAIEYCFNKQLQMISCYRNDSLDSEEHQIESNIRKLLQRLYGHKSEENDQLRLEETSRRLSTSPCGQSEFYIPPLE